MVELELFKWHEFKKNEAQVMWFRHTNRDVNGVGVIYNGNDWELEGFGNYGALILDEWQKPTRKVPQKILREIIRELIENGY